MKKLIILATVFAISTCCFAQEKTDSKMDAPTTKMDKMSKKDGVMMKDGKMMVMKGGTTMEMDHDMTMSNGTMVMKMKKSKMMNQEKM
jgi:uncharacterized protein YdeI (BOF family)